jgi:DNA replication and repair protein RecF
LMVLKKIAFQGFRNLSNAELHFADEYNFIIGANGAGKTNLLEAIYYAGLASSFRIKDERGLIRTEEQFLRVDAQTEDKQAVIYLDDQQKKVSLQGSEVNRLSEYVGWLGITLLSIEDIWLIRGAPARRRSFMNWLIAKISPVYLSNLTEYRKILRQRNKILQDGQEYSDKNVLELFDEQLIETGNEIYQARADFIPQIQKNVMSLGKEFGLKTFDIAYQSSCPHMAIDHKLLKRMRKREFIIGHTLVGPHRDDLLLSINHRPMKDFASEGEERAAAVSMKLAEAEMLFSKTGARPLLLLDEVGPELDTHKKKILLGLLHGQIFYASTRLPDFLFLKNIKHNILSVDRGVFEISSEN